MQNEPDEQNTNEPLPELETDESAGRFDEPAEDFPYFLDVF